MFSKIILLALVIACVFAAPSMDVIPLEKQQPTVIPIVSQSDELEANGTYHFSYETGNGIKREEIAYEKVIPKTQGRSASSNEGGESDESDEIHVQRGSYSYTGPDGTVYTVRYIADENGFQPIGDHLPRVPEIAQDSNSAEKSGRALKSASDSAQSASAPKLYEAKAAPAPKESSQSEEPTQPETVKTGEPVVSTEGVNISTTKAISMASSAQAEPTTASSLEEVKLTQSTESSSTESASSTQTVSEIKQTDASTTEVPEKETESTPAVDQFSTEGSGEQPSSTTSDLVHEATSTITPGSVQPSSTASSSQQLTSTDLTNSEFTSTEHPQQSTTGSDQITTNNLELSTEDNSSSTVSA